MHEGCVWEHGFVGTKPESRGGETRFRFATWPFIFRKEVRVVAVLFVVVFVFRSLAKPDDITGTILLAMTAVLGFCYLVSGVFAVIFRSPLVIAQNEVLVWTGSRTVRIDGGLSL